MCFMIQSKLGVPWTSGPCPFAFSSSGRRPGRAEGRTAWVLRVVATGARGSSSGMAGRLVGWLINTYIYISRHAVTCSAT